jgi:hypothetical protein
VSLWYYHKNLKPQGPLSFEEMKKKIMRGEVVPTDLIADGENSQWKPAVEWRQFPQELFPAFQQNYFKTSTATEKEWILLVFENGVSRQQGPYSVADLQGFLASGKVQLEDHVWRTGLTGWVQVRDRREFFGEPILRDL